jgi:hypothetical protein
MMISLGLDLGMGACKVYGPAGGIQLPSHVSVADGRVVSGLAGMKSATPPARVVVDGRTLGVELVKRYTGGVANHLEVYGVEVRV